MIGAWPVGVDAGQPVASRVPGEEGGFVAQRKGVGGACTCGGVALTPGLLPETRGGTPLLLIGADDTRAPGGADVSCGELSEPITVGISRTSAGKAD